MAKYGGGSIIVNTSSMGTRVTALPGMIGGSVYAASKAGADVLMKYAAIEVRRFCRDERMCARSVFLETCTLSRGERSPTGVPV